jgi:hypothetical protein
VQAGAALGGIIGGSAGVLTLLRAGSNLPPITTTICVALIGAALGAGIAGGIWKLTINSEGVTVENGTPLMLRT